MPCEIKFLKIIKFYSILISQYSKYKIYNFHLLNRALTSRIMYQSGVDVAPTTKNNIKEEASDYQMFIYHLNLDKLPQCTEKHGIFKPKVD